MRILEIIFTLVLLIADQVSKYLASIYLKNKAAVTIISGFFKLSYAENTGAAWSIFEGMGDAFAVIALLVSGAMIYYLWREKTLLKMERFSMILMIAGALGNMIDRVRMHYVIDFLDFYIFGYDFPVFNFADSCLTVGVIIFAVINLFVKKD